MWFTVSKGVDKTRSKPGVIDLYRANFKSVSYFKNSLFSGVSSWIENLHGLAPAYLLNEFSDARDFHSYNTRHRDLLRLRLAWTTKYQGSFRFSGAKIWNTLPLALRGEHDLNKFGFGLKRHLRSKPNWASNTFGILSCSNVFYLFSFSFHQGPIQTSLTELGTPE